MIFLIVIVHGIIAVEVIAVQHAKTTAWFSSPSVWMCAVLLIHSLYVGQRPVNRWSERDGPKKKKKKTSRIIQKV